MPSLPHALPASDARPDRARPERARAHIDDRSPIALSAPADPIFLDAGRDPSGALRSTLRISSASRAPAVILVDAPSDQRFLAAAVIAGAAAAVGTHRSARLRDARREAVLSLSVQTRREVAADVDPDDYPILAMRLDGEPVEEIARTLRLDAQDVLRRLDAIVDLLAVEPSVTPRPSPRARPTR